MDINELSPSEALHPAEVSPCVLGSWKNQQIIGGEISGLGEVVDCGSVGLQSIKVGEVGDVVDRGPSQFSSFRRRWPYQICTGCGLEDSWNLIRLQELELLAPASLLQSILGLRGAATIWECPASLQSHRSPGTGIAGSSSGVIVLVQAPVQIRGDASIEGVIGTAEEVELVFGHWDLYL